MEEKKIKYDTPIEVSEQQYKKISSEFGGIVATKKENGKYYIKVWVMKYAPYIEAILRSMT